MSDRNDTIVAPATSPGGALSLIRISGDKALHICDECFRSPSHKKLSDQEGYTIHFGNIVSSDGSFIDEVLVSVFRAPSSYTGDNMAEISCHGSRWIVAEIIRSLMDSGARFAEPGEFTVRAFLAGKLDLVQAEAVADMIASDTKASHSLAANQLRGKYSEELSALRGELLHLASLLELELDFSEEDVVFADRTKLTSIIDNTIAAVNSLSTSFSLGNAVKEGIGVAIIGSPNVGKSTLLNNILGDNRAMVSDIAGTTRDIIEERFIIDSIGFRFIDTAGIRQSDDKLEQMGIERTYIAANEAQIILYMVDATNEHINASHIEADISALLLNDNKKDDYYLSPVDRNSCVNVGDSCMDYPTKEHRKIAVVINKCDSEKEEKDALARFEKLHYPILTISAKYGQNIEQLKSFLTSVIDSDTIFGDKAIVTNARHYNSLCLAHEALLEARKGLDANISSDMLAQDLHEALHHIGTITGEITTNDILSEIFSKFCIGK